MLQLPLNPSLLHPLTTKGGGGGGCTESAKRCGGLDFACLHFRYICCSIGGPWLFPPRCWNDVRPLWKYVVLQVCRLLQCHNVFLICIQMGLLVMGSCLQRDTLEGLLHWDTVVA